MNQRIPVEDNYGSNAYRSYALFALLVIYIFSSIDRVLLSVLQEHIKLDLQLSDFQLGLLGGPAFVILYTVSQLPIARLAEKANRISIIAIGAAAWSFATASCGLASNFIQLGLARVGVGIGEAACLPPSHSVISDYFSAKKRATALAIFGLGIPIGATIAALAGGMIAQNLDWRWAFFILGIPGIFAALILKLTVKEPPRQHAQSIAPDFKTTLRFLFAKRSLRHVYIGGAMMSIFGFATTQFLVSFFMRKYDLDVGTASKYFGMIFGLGIACSILMGGVLADKLSGRFPTALTSLPAVCAFVSAPLFFMGYNQSSDFIAFLFIFFGGLLVFSFVAPTTAVGQSVAKPRMRATASAIAQTINVAVGYGIGPPLVGFLADQYSIKQLTSLGLNPEMCFSTPSLEACKIAGAGGVQFGLTVCLIFVVWGSIHFWLAGKTLAKDQADII